MAATVSDVKSWLGAKLHGSSLDKLTSPNNLIQEAARNVIKEISPAETKRTAIIANAIYDSVFDYSAPTDLDENGVIDIRPQVRRQTSDNFSQLLSEEFDLRKPENTFNVRWDDGVKTLRLSKRIADNTVIHKMDSLTANGTWAGDGTATNLTEDRLNFVSGSASINFDVSAATAPNIENSTFSAVDLSTEEDQGVIFVWVFIPATANLTSFTLRWGSSSSNFWSDTVTTPHTASSFGVGWNLLRFDWNGATETGTGVSSAIDYLRFAIAFSASTTDTDFRVDNIVSSLGEIWEVEYYSKFLFRTTAGVWGETITADTDIINLDTTAYNILLYETAFLMAQESQGEDAVFDRNFFEKKLRGDGTEKNLGLYELYKRANIDEKEKPRSAYYRMRRNRYMSRTILTRK